MAKTASQIVDRALTLIDEIPTSFTTAATTETSIRELALEILPEVCRDLVKELPWGLKKYLAQSPTSLPVDNLINGELQSSYQKQKVAFEAPVDFWELVSIQLSTWAKPVTEYIYIDSQEYDKQNNPFTRSGKQNPAVAISRVSVGSRFRIECFSLNKGETLSIQSMLYISFDNVPDDSGKTWPDEVFDEITKALATELHLIKSRVNEAIIKAEEVSNAMDQHK